MTRAMVARLDWSMFRGNPARTGAMPYSWPRTAPDCLWTSQLDDPVLASPVVGRGAVYVATRGGFVAAFDRSGHALADGGWPARIDGTVSATPAYLGGRIYVATLEGTVFALDARSGRILARAAGLGPMDASPAVDEAYGLVVVACQDGTAHGLDGQTLEHRWSFPGRGDRPPGSGFRASPAIADGALILAGEDGEVLALDLGGRSVRLRWRDWAPGAVFATPVAARGFVCIVTKEGHVAVYRTGDGRSHARGSCPGATHVLSSPALGAPDRTVLLFGGADGRIHAFDYLSGQPVARFPLLPAFAVPEPILSSPAVAGGLAIFGDEGGHLLGVEADSATVAWTIALGSPVRPSPALDGDRLYVCTEAGTLYAFVPGG